MIKLKNIQQFDHYIQCMVYVENNKQFYYFKVDTDTDIYSIVDSELPDEYKYYAGKIVSGLMNYKNKDLPNETTIMWY